MNKCQLLILFLIAVLLVGCDAGAGDNPVPETAIIVRPTTVPIPVETPQPTETVPQIETPTSQPAEEAGDEVNTWSKSFEGPDYGAFFDMVLTKEDEILAVGTSNHLHFPPYSGDALIMAFDLNGDVLWEQTWGGEGYEQAWSIVPADDGGFYIFGETDSFGAGDRDFFLLKISEDGSEEWFQTYGRERREWPYGMLGLSNSDLLLHGFSMDPDGTKRQAYVLRVDPDGEIQWEITGDAQEDELVIDAYETAEGDLVLVVIAGEDGKLVKMDQDGSIIWSKRYEIPGWQFASQIVPTDDGGFLLAGFVMGAGQEVDTWLAKIDTDGELEWEKSFGEPGEADYAQSMIRLKDDSYLIGGLGSGLQLTGMDGEGNILWSQSLLDSSIYGAKALIELDEGGFLVAGFHQLVNGRSYDAILLRTDSVGRIEE